MSDKRNRGNDTGSRERASRETPPPPTTSSKGKERVIDTAAHYLLGMADEDNERFGCIQGFVRDNPDLPFKRSKAEVEGPSEFVTADSEMIWKRKKLELDAAFRQAYAEASPAQKVVVGYEGDYLYDNDSVANISLGPDDAYASSLGDQGGEYVLWSRLHINDFRCNPCKWDASVRRDDCDMRRDHNTCEQCEEKGIRCTVGSCRPCFLNILDGACTLREHCSLHYESINTNYETKQERELRLAVNHAAWDSMEVDSAKESSEKLRHYFRKSAEPKPEWKMDDSLYDAPSDEEPKPKADA